MIPHIMRNISFVDFACRNQCSCASHDDFFKLRCDAAGKLGLSPLQKCTAALRMLAYGASAGSLDENVRIGESTALLTLRKFCTGVIEVYGQDYLRPPTTQEGNKLLEENSKRGFPGMIASIDCMHWSWKNCPVALHGQYQGKEGKPTIVLEHNILGGQWSLAGKEYCMGYLLADGIYPDWTVFMKTIAQPQTSKEKHYVRKDVERCFGILQACWQILVNPCRLWDAETMSNVITTCIILHNMRISARSSHAELQYDFESFGTQESLHGIAGFNRIDAERTFSEACEDRMGIRNALIHHEMRKDLIDHIWMTRCDYVEQ